MIYTLSPGVRMGLGDAQVHSHRRSKAELGKAMPVKSNQDQLLGGERSQYTVLVVLSGIW